MADVSHELGSLRHLVESPLSSKVAMFNNQVQQHQQAQLLNPFTTPDGRCSPKPTFSKDEYGKPLAGSLTEMRGQKANIHVMKEMLELCQIIDSEGYKVNDEPTMRVIPFGELFNIYNYISDKVVGILLRARKHKLVDFEGEMLFQRRDDDVPVYLLRPIQDIRAELNSKIEDIKRASSPAPQATSLLLDRSAHQQKLVDAGLVVPGGSKGSSKSRSPSPSGAKTRVKSKSATPEPTARTSTPSPTPAPTRTPTTDPAPTTTASASTPVEPAPEAAPPKEVPTAVVEPQAPAVEPETPAVEPVAPVTEAQDINNNETSTTAAAAEAPAIVVPMDLPTIVIEASAVHVSGESAESASTDVPLAPQPVAEGENGESASS